MTKHKLNKWLKVTKQQPNIKLCPKNKKQIQSNYYLSVASVDSNMTESTCIFPETLNKCINACRSEEHTSELQSL